jgi:poly-gamma-glutamate synthesis protein (capsule biosynthesis protein)
MNMLDKESIDNFGVGYHRESNYIHIDQRQKLIQFAFTTRSADLSGEKLFCDEDFIGPYPPNISAIKALKKKYPNYSIIVNIHWGIENVYFPEPKKRDLAYEIIDAGVDLLIGHHPHIVQPIEMYKGKYIFYSLGNFYFHDIHYYEHGINKYKKAKKYQKKGIIPIFEILNGKLCKNEILKIKIDKYGKLRTKRSGSIKTIIISNNTIYSIIYKIISEILRIKEIAHTIFKNPNIVLNRLFR